MSTPTTMENDSLVNEPVEDLALSVTTDDDFRQLRERWKSSRRIPKLVDGSTCPVILRSGGQTIRSLLKGEESSGELSVCYVAAEPGTGAPDHHQPQEDEFWFAVEGNWEWKIGTKTMLMSSGGFAYAPRNTTHAFRNVGTTRAVMFTVNTPAGHERAFQAVSKMIGAQVSPRGIEDEFAKHDFVFHTPSGVDLPRSSSAETTSAQWEPGIHGTNQFANP